MSAGRLEFPAQFSSSRSIEESRRETRASRLNAFDHRQPNDESRQFNASQASNSGSYIPPSSDVSRVHFSAQEDQPEASQQRLSFSKGEESALINESLSSRIDPGILDISGEFSRRSRVPQRPSKETEPVFDVGITDDPKLQLAQALSEYPKALTHVLYPLKDGNTLLDETLKISPRCRVFNASLHTS